MRSSTPSRMAAAFVMGILALALIAATSAAQDSTTAQTPLELLQRFPFDRLILVDNATFEIEPISPRPLPAYEPTRPKAAAPGPDAKGDDQPLPEEKVDEVIIHLLDGPQRDFKVKRSNIKAIEYFEDMLLAEARRFMLARNYPKAFEYILAVQTRNPNWKGLREAVDTLLFEEGTWSLAGNDRDRGLRLLRELFDRNPDYPGVRQRLAETYGLRVQEAISRGQYALGRRILRQLREVDPSSLVAVDLSTRFVNRAREAFQRGLAAQGPERLDALAEALQIWPALDEAVAPFEDAFRATPTLRVGVVDLPRPIAPWIRSPASARVVPLLYLPILADESEEAQIGRLPGQLAANVELGDLGRRIDLTIHRDVFWSDASRRVSAIDVVRALSDRAQPRSPAYQARWADLLDRIETLDVDRVVIRLRRTPLDPISWLTVPIGPAHAAWDGRVATSTGRLPIGNGPFAFQSQTDAEARYLALARDGTATSPSIVPIPRIVRIRELRLPDAGAAMAALAQGEIDLLEHVPADRVPTLSRDDRYVVGRYRLPELHLIALDGRNPLLRNRNFRRALSYAINRAVILEESVLKRPIDATNRPSDGPFAVGSYADAPGVAPLEYDLLTARMLVAGVRRELTLPKIELSFEYPARPEAKAAAPRLAEMLRALGLVINLVERPESELEEQLRGGRRFDLAYRVLRCDEPLREAGGLLCPGYDAPSDSDGLGALSSELIRQRLLQLEHATDWNAARDLVRRIDRECRDELPILPLWQLDDHFARRTPLTGPPDVADHLYQGIETWEISPWFVRDDP